MNSFSSRDECPGHLKRPQHWTARLSLGLILMLWICPSVVAAQPDDAADGNAPDQVTMYTEGKRPMNIALSPDGRTAAVNVAGGEIYLCDALTGDVKTLLKGHAQWAWLEFSPDGKLLASGGSQDGQLRLWDVAAGKEIVLLADFETQISTVRFSPDGKKLASAEFVLRDTDRGGTIRIWDVQRQLELKSFVADNGLTDVAFSPDGRYLASSEYAKKTVDLEPLSQVRIWDVESGKTVQRIANRAGAMSRVAFSPDGKTLAVAGYHAPHVLQASHRIELFDVKTWDLKRALTGHTQRIFGLAFTPDGKTLLTSGSDGTLRVWDLKTFAPRAVVPINSGNTVQLTLAGAPTGRLVRFAFVSNNTAEVVRIGALEPDSQSPARTGFEQSQLFARTPQAIGALAFSGDGKNLAAARGRRVHYWDATTSADLPPLAFSNYPVRAFSPDLRLAVSVGRSMEVWNVTTRGKAFGISSAGQGTYQPLFSPGGRFLAASALDRSIKLWDMQSGKLWAAAPVQRKTHPYLAFTPDGRRLISTEFAPEGRIVFWDLPPEDAPVAKADPPDEPDKPAGHRPKVGQPDKTPEKIPEEVTAALKKAYELVTNRNSSFEALQGALGPVFPMLPQITPHTGKQEPKWHRLQVSRDGSKFAAIRFKSPLKKEADLEWAFVAPHMTNWYILPREGRMKGFKNFTTERDVRVKGAQLPENERLFLQRLPGGELKPDAEYLLWFRFNTADPVELQLCVHLCETGTHADVNSSVEIARAIGLKTPFTFRTVTDIPLKTGKVLAHGKQPAQIAVSPDGKRLVSVDTTGEAKLWDLESGEVLRTFAGGVTAFSPDGKSLAVGGLRANPTEVLLLETETGRQLKVLRGGHVRTVLHLAFSPDGQRLASGGAAGVVALWNLNTGRQDWSAFEFPAE